ncbi:MAG: hypothetical protein MUF87_07030 [Anaerolineae bacterium]|jgi:hypothetical protein|nr:hypothetical protein [Anaerolineae bacterium]
MELEQILKAIDGLSLEDRQQVYEYLSRDHPAPEAIDVERIKTLFAELRDGFSEADLEALEWAMNVEEIRRVDGKIDAAVYGLYGLEADEIALLRPTPP